MLLSKILVTMLATTASIGLTQTLSAQEAAQTSHWLTSLDAAKSQAKSQNKPIYLLFTGTEWCPWCIKMERDVFSKPGFWSSFQNKFVFIKVDIGRKQTDEQTHLMDMYGIMGVPSVLILNADGQEVGRLGYPSGPLGDSKTPLEIHSKELSDFLNRSKS